MLLGLLLLLLLSLYQVKFNFNGFNGDYLSKDSTNSIKGIFILLIVISHSLQYIKASGYAFDDFGDLWFLQFFSRLSQLVVVMFLFYSGYGVSESIKSKGETYVKAMPRHRIFGTLVNFDIAVLVYIALNLLLGLPITFKQSVLSLTGWDSVGNSNWYIFVILLCYLMTYFVLRLPVTKRSQRCAILFALCAFCLFVLSFYKENYWHNTILCYPMGFLYSTYRDKIETHIKRFYWRDALVLLLFLIVVYLCHHNWSDDRFEISYNMMSIVFALIMIMLTIKVRIANGPLMWIGKHLFPIYIYMRLPMIVMEQKTPTLVGTYPAVFILIALAVTLLIARCYKYWEIKL